MSIFKTEPWSECGKALSEMYNGPTRFYHNLAHVLDCLEILSHVPKSMVEDREAVELALWFHDAIYDATRSDNESASAGLAVEWLSKMSVSLAEIAAVERLIRITDHRSVPQTKDEILIVDIDLSILGREANVYDRYAKAIRQEYAHVPDPEYRAGRIAVLRSFLEREQIFWTAVFREKYEASARRNVATEIAELASF